MCMSRIAQSSKSEARLVGSRWLGKSIVHRVGDKRLLALILVDRGDKLGLTLPWNGTADLMLAPRKVFAI